MPAPGVGVAVPAGAAAQVPGVGCREVSLALG